MASSPEHLSDELEELELSVTSSDSDDATIQYEAQQSFGTDAYNIFVMNIVLLVLTEQFDQVSEFLIELVTTTVLIGAIIGQIVFGQLADKYGRTKMFMVTMGIIALFSAASASSPKFGKTGNGLFVWLAVMRFFLGLGIGGEYPLSATITAQSSTKETLGRNMAIVICSQGFGNLVAAAFCAVLIYAGAGLEWVWRNALLLPVLTVVITAYPRYMLSESTTTASVLIAPPTPDLGSRWMMWKNEAKSNLAKIWDYKLTLLGTAGSWFLFDVSFYGNSLFNATVMKILNFEGDPLHQTALFCLVISVIGLPGYFASIIFAERLGRKNIQILGFAMMAIIFTIMGAAFDKLSKDLPKLFVVLYGLTFFFSNFGPNVTTYTIPAEVFPDDIAATCFGISAAFGKLGAFLGTILFSAIKANFGVPAVFGLCAILSLIGLFLTVFVTKDMRNIQEEVGEANPGESTTAREEQFESYKFEARSD